MTQARSCGACSLCCTVLRVDELAKLGGTPCVHVVASGEDDGGGCGIHARRPAICRGYRCLWLSGKLRDEDRPDRLGAVLDLVPTGGGGGGALRLSIREGMPGAFERSPRLQEIAAVFREQLPVRVTDVADVLDATRPFRVLLANGEEQLVVGDVVTTLRDGAVVATRSAPWPERLARRASLAWQRRKLRRLGSR